MTARETRACGRLGGGCARSGAPDGAGQRTAAPGAPTGFLRGRRRPELTTGEAEAWRDGVAAAARAARAMARRIRASAKGDGCALACAARLEMHADALAEMEPPG